MQQCHSGGFIDNLRNSKTFISTACRADQGAQPADTENEQYNGNWYSHGEYNYYIISAIAKANPLGGAVNADTSGDNKMIGNGGLHPYLQIFGKNTKPKNMKVDTEWFKADGDASGSTTFAMAHRSRGTSALWPHPWMASLSATWGSIPSSRAI